MTDALVSGNNIYRMLMNIYRTFHTYLCKSEVSSLYKHFSGVIDVEILGSCLMRNIVHRHLHIVTNSV